MKKGMYLFIVNPVAGKNRGLTMIPLIQRACEERGVSFEIVKTEKAGGAEAATSIHLKKGYSTVVAVGGDGTINEVLNGMGNSTAQFGIIPCGTGNDFAKTMDIPLDPIAALACIFEGALQQIDRGKAHNKYFINIASVGLDAEIAHFTNKIKKWIKGPSAYIVALLKTLVTYRPMEVQITLENQVLHQEVMLVAICNGQYYGGGMKIAPNAVISDGLLDICVIEKMSKLKLLYLFPGVFKGIHTKYKEVKIYRASGVTIKGRLNGLVNIDGEMILLPVDESTKNSQLSILLEPKKIGLIGKETLSMEIAN